jgi:hypothetical protein
VTLRWAIPLILLVACARQPLPEGDAPPPDIRNAEITIIVKNQHWLDINIYLMRGTLSERLGMASGPSDKVFTVPWTKVGGSGQIRLRADPVGQGRGHLTEFFMVRPGSVVEWTIGSGLRYSNIAVY